MRTELCAMLLRRKAGLPTEWEHLNTARSIPRGSKPWVRARRASLALLPQRPRQNQSSTGADVPCEPPPFFSFFSPGFEPSMVHPLQLAKPLIKFCRLQRLNVGFNQLAKLAGLGRSKLTLRNSRVCKQDE